MEEVIASEDRKYLQITNYFKEVDTGKKIGKVVITLAVKEKELQIIDADITLISKDKVILHFETKLEGSSDANEYYHVYDLKDERHFEIETVNRYLINEKEIEGTNQEVYLSCFPFQLSLFDNQEALDNNFGFLKEIDIPGLGKQKVSMGSDMMASGRAMLNNIEEPCSFIIGKISDYRDVKVNIAGIEVNFTIINLDTGIGIIPVALHEDNFNIKGIARGKLVAMVTDVKADFKGFTN